MSAVEFTSGQVVYTPGAIEALNAAGERPALYGRLGRPGSRR